MTVEWTAPAPDVRGLRLADADVAITLLPDKGCDIHELVDLRTGTDVLFKSPWGLRQPGRGPRAPSSAGHWLQQYPGGWQLVLPNGGAPSEQGGTEWGFHGEACLLPWSVQQTGDTAITAETELFYAPLRVRREISVRAATLLLHETVTNTAPEPVELMWGHHPAFGAPFLERGGRIATGARTYTADDLTPGTLLAPGSSHPWPLARTAVGEVVDLSAIPGPDEPRDHLGYLTDFSEPWFAITNPRIELAVALRWSSGVLDRAWFWQEIHSSSGFPWYRRAYVTAIEPNSTIPAQGLAAAKRKGGTPVVLAGGASRDVELRCSLSRGRGRVTGVDEQARVTWDRSG